jgi:NitT/TauT family transport system permease protein
MSRPLLGTAVLVVALVAVWQFAVSVLEVSPFLVPAPADVAQVMAQLAVDPELWADAATTLYEVLVGFGLALAVGVGAGVLLGHLPFVERTVRPLVVALQVVPKIALVPVFVIWFGFGPASKILTAAILAFFPIMLNTLLGVRSVDPGHLDVLRGLGATRRQTFASLELPSTLPYVFAGAEVAIVFAVIGAIVGEYLGGNAGLGHLVIASLNTLDAPRLFAVIAFLTVLGAGLLGAVTVAKRLTIPWHDSQDSRN